MSESSINEIQNSLSQKVSKGIIWVTCAAICARGLSFVTAVIVARMLAPSDFGLMAIAMAIISFIQGTTQTGFQSALIQKQEKIDNLLNTTWSCEVLRCFVLALIVLATAPLIAVFFHEQRVVGIIRVLSIAFLTQGLGNVGILYFRKNLDFKKQFIFDVIPMLVNIIVLIGLVLLLKNVWALVFSTLITGIVSCIISYVMHPYRPRFELNVENAKELINFGKWIFGQNMITMFMDQAITMFIGKFHGVLNLGFFNRANTFSAMIFHQMNDVIWKVGYPAYSQLQEEPIKFKKAYLQTLQLLTFFIFPMIGGLLALNYEFVHVFLTDKWLPIIPLIQIFCIQAILNCISTPAAIVLQSSGNPGIGTKITAIGVLILALIIYPFSVAYGMKGVISAVLLSTLVTCPIMWYTANKITKCSGAEFIRPIGFSFINSLSMFFCIVLIKNHICKTVYVIEFTFLIFAGLIIYATSTYLLDKGLGLGMYSLLKQRIIVFERNSSGR